MVHRSIALLIAGLAVVTASCSSSSLSPCESTNCDANATCTDTTGVAVCACRLGFFGNGKQCAACAPCGSGKFQSAACSSTTVTQCSNCSTCGPDTFQSAACTATADTQCPACTVCPQGKFASSTCTTANDTKCATCSGPCTANQFESSACTPLTNRVCAACSPPCQMGQYQASACTTSADRVCQQCSGNCPAQQYLKSACTANADRVCVGPPKVPTNGLLVRWALDDAIGTSAGDTSGNGRVAALKNVTWFSSNCKLASCPHFSGASGGNGSYLTYGSTIAIGGGGASFVAWVQLDKPSTGSYQTLFNGPYDNCCTVRFLIDANLHPFWDAGMYSDQSISTYTFPLATWVHVAWTIAAGGKAILYVNGSNVAQSGAGVPGALVDLPNVDVAAADSFQWPFKGFMNDVLIYSRVLTANEVTTLYQSY